MEGSVDVGMGDVVRILELMGSGAAFILRGGSKTLAKGAKGVWNSGRYLHMQRVLASFYKNTGKHKTMPLKTLAKRCGGDFRILNIPIEAGMHGEKELIKFYDALKRVHIPFTEMEDLVPGDGFTQIAYDPADAERLKQICDMWPFPDGKKAEDISFDDYWNSGTKEKQDEVLQYALIEAGKEEKQEKAQGKDTSKKKDSINEKTTKKKTDYYKILGVKRTANEIEIRLAYKELARKFHPDLNPNDKKIEKKFKEITEAYGVLSNPKTRKLYDEYGDDYLYTREMREYEKNADKSDNASKSAEETIKSMRYESKMDYYASHSDEYVLVSIDKEKLVLSETDENYTTRIPGTFSKTPDEFGVPREECLILIIPKSETEEIRDGKTIRTYLKKNGENNIYKYDKSRNLYKKMKPEETYGSNIQKHYSRAYKTERQAGKKQNIKNTNKPTKKSSTGKKVAKI